MRYAIKQKLMAFGDDFNVYDDSGQRLYFVDGKAMSFGHDLSVKGGGGSEVARIQQKLFTFAPTYTVSGAVASLEQSKRSCLPFEMPFD